MKKEMLLMYRLKITCVFVLLLTTFCLNKVIGATSSPFLELKMVFKESGFEIYKNPIALQMAQARLNQIVDPEEKQEISTMLSDFLTLGFRSDSFKYFIFNKENRFLREPLLYELIQRSEYALNEQFLRDIYNHYINSPSTYDFNAFKSDEWIKFTKHYNKNTFDTLTQLLDSNPDITQYLRILYYGYSTDQANSITLDANVKRQYLDSLDLNITKIDKIYNELTQDYWRNLSDKKKWILGENALRLYRDFSPEEWCKLEMPVLLNFANILERSGLKADDQAISVRHWLGKIGKSIKEAPESRDEVRSLLAYYLRNSGLSLRESFTQLEHLFRDDQAMFVALHASPPNPSPIAIWHDVSENISDCITILQKFFSLERQNDWTVELLNCLKDHYYSKYNGRQDDLFQGIITPIYQQAQPSNIVRKQLLEETQKEKENEPFLIDAHRYEIAHYLFNKYKMTDKLLLKGQRQMEVFEYVLKVYENLNPMDKGLYETHSLKETIGIIPNSNPDRIVIYINEILGKPLKKLCYAFMGRVDDTDGVIFELNDNVRVIQLERILKRIVFLKGELRTKYEYALGDIPILREISQEIINEMEDAIKNKNPKKIVKMASLTLKITAILDDDSYLKRVLVALREDVFGIIGDPYLFRKLSDEELDKKVEYFQIIHSEDLVEALRAIGEAKYLIMFYEELYIPLRSIFGFFSRTGAEPYKAFIKEFNSKYYKKTVSLEERLDVELESFAKIMDNAGVTKYINAEKTIVDLLAQYYTELEINLWESLETIVLSKNVNVGVLFRLLTEKQKDTKYWKLTKYEDTNRASGYKNIATVFLDITKDKNNMIKRVNNNKITYYTKWDFFEFLNSLLSLYEIYGFPFNWTDPGSLYTGNPIDGVNRITIIYDGSFSTPRKVDGSLRANIYEHFKDISENSESDINTQSIWETIIELALLFPNMADNNAGNQNNLTRYNEIKSEVFTTTANNRLNKIAVDSEQKVKWLIWLCRIEASVYGLGDTTKGFGYEDIRNKSFNTLGPDDRTKLLLEEFRLMLVNQTNDREELKNNISVLADVVKKLLTGFRKNYNLLDEDFDTVSKLILKLYKKVTPSKIIEGLKDEHVESLWFLTTKYRDLMINVAGQMENLKLEDKKRLVSLTSDVLEIYNYFLPYVDSRFNIDALLDESHKNALLVFAMINREIKKPLVDILLPAKKVDNKSIYEEGYKESKKSGDFVMKPLEIKTFLMSHNFLPIKLLEKSLDNIAVFERLVNGEEVSVVTYNFKILWKREDRGKISMENLCAEVLDGIDLNKRLLAEGTEFSDEQYLEYFFGDMRKVFDEDSRFRSEIPQNFDSVVQSLAKLPGDKRFRQIINTLTKRLNSSTEEKEKKQLREALKTAKGFKETVQKALSQGYEYFGRVLAERFDSIFAVQRACEMAGKKIVGANPGKNKDFDEEAYGLYSSFYQNGLFDGGKFHPELSKEMIKKFYPIQKKDEVTAQYKGKRRDEFSHVINGRNSKLGIFIEDFIETEGLIATAQKFKEERTIFETLYLNSFIGLLQSIFCGEGLTPDIPFIGDIAWGKNNEGSLMIKPLDYDQREGEIRELLRWVYESAKKYERIPELRGLFVEDNFVVEDGL